MIIKGDISRSRLPSVRRNPFPVPAGWSDRAVRQVMFIRKNFSANKVVYRFKADTALNGKESTRQEYWKDFIIMVPPAGQQTCDKCTFNMKTYFLWFHL